MDRGDGKAKHVCGAPIDADSDSILTDDPEVLLSWRGGPRPNVCHKCALILAASTAEKVPTWS